MDFSNTIKSWAEDDRPREKMQLKGISNLSDAELLAILINSGTKSKSALDLAKEALQLSENNLDKFAKISLSELTSIKGIGNARAITILAALELGRRRHFTEAIKPNKISGSNDAYLYMKDKFLDLPHEEFHIILLNRGNIIIKGVKISQGGIHGTIADGKIIFRHAIENSATGIILCHNHPSGQLNPSEQDIRLTKNLKEFGQMVGIDVLDHVIFTDNGYYSFADSHVNF